MIAPRVISFDLDDTLWPVAPVLAAAEAALLSWLRVRHPRAAHGHDVASMRALRERVAERFPEHRHDMTFLRRRALAEQFAAAGYAGTAATTNAATNHAAVAGPADAELPVQEALEMFLQERCRVTIYPDVRPALERLRVRCRLFAMSNGNADLDRCGIADLFDGHVTASAAGAAKPDARIFAHLLRLARVESSEVMHIGDDPLADVVGATRAGMQAVWLNREARPWPPQFEAPSRTVTTLADIV